MILNPRQVSICLDERAQLLRLLLQDEEDGPALAAFSDREDILSGMHSEWAALAKRHAIHPASAPLPSQGHVFISAVVEPHPRMLQRILVHIGMDIERTWPMPGIDPGWSAWLWVASTLRDDGALEEQVVYDSWTILLPHLLAAGLDLSLPMKNGTTRREWLEEEDISRFEEALVRADELRLQWNTLQSFNNASRRL